MDSASIVKPLAARRIPRGHPLYQRANRAVTRGELARPLPGVFVRAGDADWPQTRAAAICAYDPDAVITGAAAFALGARGESAWPSRISFVTSRQWRVERSWALPRQGRVDPEMVRDWPLRHVRPEMAALQMGPARARAAITQGLRERAFDVPALVRAVEALAGTAGGGVDRHALLRASLDNPWSVAEADLHEVLRAAGFTGWEGNFHVRCGQRSYFLDVAFPDAKVAIELDGFTFHGDRRSFEADRRRDAALLRAGWLVIHVTPKMVAETPAEVVGAVRRALESRK